MKRRVSLHVHVQRAPPAEKESSDILLNQASERHTRNGSEQSRDGVTGAPVTGLEYKHARSMPYLKRPAWRQAGEYGVAPR